MRYHFPLLVHLGPCTALCSPEEVLTALGQRRCVLGGGLPQFALGCASVGLTALPTGRSNREPGAHTAGVAGQACVRSLHLPRELGVGGRQPPMWGSDCYSAAPAPSPGLVPALQRVMDTPPREGLGGSQPVALASTELQLLWGDSGVPETRAHAPVPGPVAWRPTGRGAGCVVDGVWARWLRSSSRIVGLCGPL